MQLDSGGENASQSAAVRRGREVLGHRFFAAFRRSAQYFFILALTAFRCAALIFLTFRATVLTCLVRRSRWYSLPTPPNAPMASRTFPSCASRNSVWTGHSLSRAPRTAVGPLQTCPPGRDMRRCWRRVMRTGLISLSRSRALRQVPVTVELTGQFPCGHFAVMLRASQVRPRYARRPTTS